jgi:hypothetical protein
MTCCMWCSCACFACADRWGVATLGRHHVTALRCCQVFVACFGSTHQSLLGTLLSQMHGADSARSCMHQPSQQLQGWEWPPHASCCTSYTTRLELWVQPVAMALPCCANVQAVCSGAWRCGSTVLQLYSQWQEQCHRWQWQLVVPVHATNGVTN